MYSLNQSGPPGPPTHQRTTAVVLEGLYFISIQIGLKQICYASPKEHREHAAHSDRPTHARMNVWNPDSGWMFYLIYTSTHTHAGLALRIKWVAHSSHVRPRAEQQVNHAYSSWRRCIWPCRLTHDGHMTKRCMRALTHAFATNA